VLVRLGQEVQEVPRRLTAPSPPLADDAIRLEPLDERFIADFDRLMDDPDVVRNTRVPSNPPAGFAARWVGRYVKGWQDGSCAGFAIVSGDDSFLGFVAVVGLDLPARQGEIGYVVARDARGRGIAGRALELITDWALDGLLLERVELRIDVGNTPSIRVAERIGYRREGVLRSLHFKEDVRSDVAVYSLVRGDER
jgi:RimJ/RimL family protein N-acetyltransferase